jgi:hypothetical protein
MVSKFVHEDACGTRLPNVFAKYRDFPAKQNSRYVPLFLVTGEGKLPANGLIFFEDAFTNHGELVINPICF